QRSRTGSEYSLTASKDQRRHTSNESPPRGNHAQPANTDREPRFLQNAALHVKHETQTGNHSFSKTLLSTHNMKHRQGTTVSPKRCSPRTTRNTQQKRDRESLINAALLLHAQPALIPMIGTPKDCMYCYILRIQSTRLYIVREGGNRGKTVMLILYSSIPVSVCLVLKAAMASSKSSIACIVMVGLCWSAVNAQLSISFYRNTCPSVSTIVNAMIKQVVTNQPRMGASLLRLHFHDCFVN
ncbi:hypothetical protein KI387_023175, partial [Taxus chinensis]